MNNSSLMIALGTGMLSALGTWTILPVLRRHVLDLPNARSAHKTPVPRGGGIAMIGAALAGLALAGLPLPIAGAALVLTILCFIDDMRGLPVGVRFLVQILAVCFALHEMTGRVLPEFIPAPVEMVLLALAWLWFINLTNFMDGIDGISAMQVIMVCVGVAVLHLMHGWRIPHELAVQGAVLAAAAYGFYLFNKHPAKLFMGDSGSVPLGFLVGYLLITLASDGFILAALTLPAYYVGDATFTLLRRALRREKVWQAHSQHAYQHAVRGGLTHAQVVSRISWLNAVLIGLAMAGTVSMMAGILCLLAAYGLTFWLMRHFFHGTVS